MRTVERSAEMIFNQCSIRPPKFVLTGPFSKSVQAIQINPQMLAKLTNNMRKKEDFGEIHFIVFSFQTLVYAVAPINVLQCVTR